VVPVYMIHVDHYI